MPFLGPVTIVSSCCLLEDVAITVEINLNSRSEIVRRALRSPPGSSSLPRSRRANWPAAGPPSASTGVKSARQRCRAIADPEFVLSPASGTVGPQSENDRTREGRRAPARCGDRWLELRRSRRLGRDQSRVWRRLRDAWPPELRRPIPLTISVVPSPPEPHLSLWSMPSRCLRIT